MPDFLAPFSPIVVPFGSSAAPHNAIVPCEAQVGQPPFGSAIRHQFASSANRAHLGRRNKLSGCNVLIVEDEMLIALDLELVIEDTGAHAMGPVQTVESGLSLLDDPEETQDIDVAIVDIDLHGKNGLDIAHGLQKRNIPFLFHTGQRRSAELKQEWPDVPVCSKPVSPEYLLDVAGSLLSS